MQVQLCKICGERHHRYEPHRFEHYGDARRVAPEAPRSNARSPSPRIRDKDHKSPASGLSAQEPDASLGTPDTPPSTPPLSIAALDDTALRSLRNLVMAEVMRRTRAQKEPK